MPSLQHPTVEWSSLQDVFYRKHDIYSLQWAINDLADYRIAHTTTTASFLAFVRDPKQIVALGKAALIKPKILVYTPAGQLLDTIPLDPSNRIVALGFTAAEQLVVVLDEGIVRLYTLLSPCPTYLSSTSAAGPSAAATSANAKGDGQSSTLPIEATSNSYYTQRSLGQEATETGVVDVRFWNGGLVALTGAGRYVVWSFPSAETSDLVKATSQSWNLDAEAGSAPQLLPPADPSGSYEAGAPPSAWTILPPSLSTSGLVEVLFSPAPKPTAGDGTSSSAPLSNGTIYTLDSLAGLTDMRLSRGPFTAIRPSPNGKLIAFLTHDRKIWVVSADLQRSLSEYDVSESEAYIAAPETQRIGNSSQDDKASGVQDKGGLGGTGIRQIEWCGNNAVALAFSSEVVLVGPFGDALRYPYPSSVHLVPETDGLRIISVLKHEFVQKVPESSVDVFRPGSSHASAILFDAAEQFARRSPKADDGIRAIRSDLALAVDTCVSAAGYEWEVSWQRKLLRAASFGKTFLDAYDPKTFIDMARTLRVLNAARHYEIAVPISYDEFEEEGPQVLLARLTTRNHHLLSLRIAEHLSVRPDAILKHWARAKIARSRPSTVMAAAAAAGGNSSAAITAGSANKIDDAICDAIVAKSQKQSAISYAEIAATAWRAGRIRLATKLLDHEPRAVDQVPLLLNMHEDKLALVKAIESGDTDLVQHVLLRLQSQLSRGDFFRIVQAPINDSSAAPAPAASGGSGFLGGGGATAGAQPDPFRPTNPHALAAHLLVAYAREQDHELLRDFYYQDDRRDESALLALEEADVEKELADKVVKLRSAQKLFSDDKERALEAKLTDEHVRLLSFQSALEAEDAHRGTTFLGLSLGATIHECLVRNMAAKADKLRQDWKVSEKRFWAIKVGALVQMRDWEVLWTFVNSKKPPSGYEPLVTRLVAANQRQQALRYVSLCTRDKADRLRLIALTQRLADRGFAGQMADVLEDS